MTRLIPIHVLVFESITRPIERPGASNNSQADSYFNSTTSDMDPLPDLFYPKRQSSITLKCVSSRQFLDDPLNAFRCQGKSANALSSCQNTILHRRISSTLMAFPSFMVHIYSFNLCTWHMNLGSSNQTASSCLIHCGESECLTGGRKTNYWWPD